MKGKGGVWKKDDMLFLSEEVVEELVHAPIDDLAADEILYFLEKTEEGYRIPLMVLEIMGLKGRLEEIVGEI